MLEIGQNYIPAFISLQHGIVEMLSSVFVEYAEAFLGQLLLLLLGGALCFLYGDLVIVGQPAYGLGVGQLFVLLYKADHIAGLATAEAFIDALCSRNRERRSFFVMERAIGDIIGPALFEAHELADDIDDVGAAHYLLYTGGGYHSANVRNA